jgi:hypothetical protein
MKHLPVNVSEQMLEKLQAEHPEHGGVSQVVRRLIYNYLQALFEKRQRQAMRQAREEHRRRGGPDFGSDPDEEQAALAEAVLQAVQEEQARKRMREALRQAVREMRNESDIPRSKAISETAMRLARRLESDFNPERGVA